MKFISLFLFSSSLAFAATDPRILKECTLEQPNAPSYVQVCECAYAKAEAKIPEDLKAEFTQTGDVTKHSQKLRDFLTPLKGECFGEMMTKAMNEQAKAVACSFRFAFYDENGKEISNGVTSNENMKTVEDCQKKCKARTEEEPMDWPFEKGARSIKGKCLFQGKDAGDYSHSRPAR